MAEKIRGILINVDEATVSVEEVEDDFRELQRELQKIISADFFEIARRKIGSKLYAIICDDEGMLKDRRISAINRGYSEDILVGNLFICNELGPELVSLLDVDIIRIIESIRYNAFDGSPILLLEE